MLGLKWMNEEIGRLQMLMSITNSRKDQLQVRQLKAFLIQVSRLVQQVLLRIILVILNFQAHLILLVGVLTKLVFGGSIVLPFTLPLKIRFMQGHGIWRTNNGGYNWSNITEFVENLGVSDIEIDPNNTDVIYWLSGDYDGSDVFYTAIFKSTDGGNSWQEIDLNNTINPLSHQTFYSTILVYPDNSNIVMVAIGQKITF